MNIDHGIVARAFNKAGQEPLTDKEWEEKSSTRYRVVYDFYLETILETLAQTDWTSQKKRVRLTEAEEENLSTYRFMYLLPIDCAKTVELNNEERYIVEDSYLYTDQENAVLTYISDLFRNDFKYDKAEPEPDESTDFNENAYYIYDEESKHYIRAYEFIEDTDFFVRVEEDYNFHRDFSPDPLLSEYIETRLAAKIALKLSGDQKLYQLLYGESQIMENKAVKASAAQGQNRDTGNRYWSEILGLPDNEDI